MNYTSVTKESGRILSTEGLPIRYDLYIPSVSVQETFPVILFLHGFKGFKDWGPFPDACEELTRAGFAVVSFNFSHSGIGASMDQYDHPELFATMTLSQDVRDVGSVIAALKEGDITTDKVILDAERIGLVGHSRGGHTAIVASAEFPEVQCLVAWAPVADFSEFWTESMIADWREKGFTEVENTRTGRKMALGREGYDDLMTQSNRFTALKRIAELYIPTMLIAGKQDESVPVSHSERLFRLCPADSREIRLIPETGHTFGAAHPFENQDYPVAFDEVLEFTENWFLENLS